ncbi:MAG: POTRA domain-containing protein, partial [Planctomycetota bacterium]
MIGDMRAALALTVGVALLLAFSADAKAQPQTVAEVRVKGNKYMSVEAILQHVQTRVGQRYDGEVVRADVRRLLDTKRFERVVVSREPTDRGIIVTFEVVEKPPVASVTFIGNRAFKAEKLAKALTFGRGDPLSVAEVERGRQAIERKYRDSGYIQVHVEYDSRLLEEQRKVVYRIR